ncbi:hypothetical protein PG999_012599 [Apiospora kogelbergensis]|uniref:Uncharacterized protein n=1 Tax=Apiospora kogelbergensis TaxID=1337665 RepID=A0AAW0Q7D4_9PEZI
MGRLLAFAALAPLSTAVLVANNSPCGTKCGNVLDSTTPGDLVCTRSDYGASAGSVWKSCIGCEMSSPYTTLVHGSNTTDLQFALLNMRHAVDGCLFNGVFDDTPCITRTACGLLKDSIEYNVLASNSTAFGYCSTWDSSQVAKCGECLQNLDGGHFLRNYINVLDGACTMKPSAGITLSLEGELFSETDLVNVTLPRATSEFRNHGPAGPLSLGQIVGIAIGGVLALLAIMGFCVVWNGKRRRKAYLSKREAMHKTWPSPHAGSGGEMFETPVSQRPLRNWDGSPVSQRPFRNWDESPVSAATEHTYPGRYFSPYSSQFTSPVSGVSQPPGATDGHHGGWPTEKTHQHQNYNNIGVAISPDSEHGNNAFWGDKKGKDRMQQHNDGYENADAYEMQEGISSAGGYTHEPQQHQQYHQNIAPVLEHPGYGRRSRE